MRRREFIKLIGGVALSGSNAAIAQPAITVVGLLSSRTLDDSELAAIRDGLNEFGYVAGRTVEIEYRSADSKVSPALKSPFTTKLAAVAMSGAKPKSATSGISPNNFVFITHTFQAKRRGLLVGGGSAQGFEIRTAAYRLLTVNGLGTTFCNY
jgi:putative ABC transport system substrate-binding protein